MNIIAAIKSGKRFRRPGFPTELWYSYPGSWKVMTRSDEETYNPDKDDILADDWIIEEEKIEITKEQFDSMKKDLQ